MKKHFLNLISHLILIIFSLIIILPLLWILRNSFTNKLNAYKIPPELYYFIDNLKVKERIKYLDIFVSIGSTLNIKKVNIIKKIIKSNQDFKFILAPNFKNKIKENKLKNLTICKQKNYFKSLESSYSCITNAGNSLLEAIYYNKPCFVFPQTEKEMIFAKHLIEKKLIADINNFNNINNDLLVNSIKKNTMNKIDNKGLMRFLKLLKNL